MNWVKNLLIKLVGKKLKVTVDGKLEKWGFSREKIAGVLAILLPVVEPLSTALGHPIVITPEIYAMLAGLGFWAKRDRDEKAAIQTVN